MIPYPRLPPTLSSSQTIISRDIVCCQNQEQEEQKSRAELNWVKSEYPAQAIAQAEPSPSHKFKERDVVSALSFV